MAEQTIPQASHTDAGGFDRMAGLMEEVQTVPQWKVVPGSKFFVINRDTVIMTWLVMAILIGVAVLVRRRMKKVPDRLQGAVEATIEFLDEILHDVFGEDARKFASLIMTILFFVLLSNWIGIIPFCKEPTKDLNTTLGLGLGIVFVVSHGSAIRKRGLVNYIKEFFQPMWFLFPLNIVGELAKPVSHSFRLFGNIFGGGLIILVVSTLVYYILLPVFLQAFFGLFVGLVQAFVFMMLAAVYIATLRGD